MNERELITRTLQGKRTHHIAWATRLDIWHESHRRSGSLPSEFDGLDLTDIHRQVGIGRQCYEPVFTTRLRGVEATVEFNGSVIQQDVEPWVRFPKCSEYVVSDQPGDTLMTFKTPVGSAQIRYRTNVSLVKGGAAPYMVKRLLEDREDFPVVKWILDHMETLPSYDGFRAREEEIGDQGLTIGMMDRVPFQRLLLDFFGEEQAILELYDGTTEFEWLLETLEIRGREILEVALGSPALVVEFPDNIEGMITSPTLFEEHCMPFLQEAADRVHQEGRLLASHMDGNLAPLIDLIPECGVDVVESFSPAPLSALSFEEAWEAWRGKVLIWGGIPSPLFEHHVPRDAFERRVSQMLDLIGDDTRIILGIGDQAMGPTLIERVAWVSQLLGRS